MPLPLAALGSHPPATSNLQIPAVGLRHARAAGLWKLCRSCEDRLGASFGRRRHHRTDDLRITRVFPCVARAFKAYASFMFAGCCWRRSLAVDGSSGTSRGHAWRTGRSEIAPCMRADAHDPACRFIPSPSAHPLGSGPGSPGPAGAPNWTNDLDLESLVCSALPGRTVMGEPATYLSHTKALRLVPVHPGARGPRRRHLCPLYCQLGNRTDHAHWCRRPGRSGCRECPWL